MWNISSSERRQNNYWMLNHNWSNIFALMMEAVSFSETMVNMYHLAQCYIPEDGYLHAHGPENLKTRGLLTVLSHCKLRLSVVRFDSIKWSQMASRLKIEHILWSNRFLTDSAPHTAREMCQSLVNFILKNEVPWPTNLPSSARRLC